MAYGVRCAECGAKFALSDELFERKVKGRVVTVRCKQCQTDITVDGVELASGPLSEHPRPFTLEESAIDSGPGDGTPTIPLVTKSGRNTIPPVKGLWLISFGADDDRELTPTQIRRALDRGEIDGETIVWREGMPDWLPIAEIPDLAKLAPETEEAPGGFLGTGMGVRGADAALQSALKKAKSKRPTLAPPPSDSSNPKLEPPQEPKVEAPKAEAPKAEAPPVVDPPDAEEVGPFRSVGSGTFEVEDEAPASSQPLSIKDADLEIVPSEAKPKTKSKPPPKTPPPPRARARKPQQVNPDPDPEGLEGSPSESGTPDLRSLTTGIRPPTPKKRDNSERIDESLLTLGTGSIGASLAPPTIDLTTAPVPDDLEEPNDDRKSDAPKKGEPEGTTRSTPARQPKEDEESKGSPVWWLLLGAAALVAIVWWIGRPPSGTDADGVEPTEPSAAHVAETTALPTETSEPPDIEATAEPTTSATESPAATETSSVASKPPEMSSKVPTEPGEQPTGQPKEPTEQPKEPTEEPKEPTEEPKEVPIAAPFDKGAASAALGRAAGSASGCRKEGDPSGTARVAVTFANSGRVTSATVNGPPFAGTATGGCIASRMRGAHVPPFSGPTVTVRKTVSIQ